MRTLQEILKQGFKLRSNDGKKINRQRVQIVNKVLRQQVAFWPWAQSADCVSAEQPASLVVASEQSLLVHACL